MLGARILRDWSTHILVSSTRLVVVVLILTCIRVSWAHIFVDIATCRWLWTVVIGRWVVGRIIRWVRGIRKVAVYVAYRSCWWWREVVGLWKITGVIGVCGRLTRAELARTVASARAVAALTIGRLIFV